MSNEVEKLVSEIKRHQNLYYNDVPEISDDEFDALWDRLTKIDPTNEILTKKIGEDSAEDHAKVKHLIPMGSQQKATTPEAFLKWAIANLQVKYVVENKYDGVSAELQYKKGIFQVAVSRGQGIKGFDISYAVKQAKGFVSKLDPKFTGGVRVEILMLLSVFNDLYADTSPNPRNMAGGIAKRQSGDGGKDLFLMSYDAVSIDGDYFADEVNKVAWLAKQGFNTTEVKLLTAQEIVAYRDEMDKATRATLPYEIDGLVIKCNEIDAEDAKEMRPKKQIAFKFPSKTEITTLLDVEWSVSGGNVTPVAVFKPVNIGAVLQRASLANPNEIIRKKLMLGAQIMVSRRNDVIPKVESVVYVDASCRPIILPTICTKCGSKLVNEGTSFYCPNEECDNKKYRRLQAWIKKLGVKFFGESILLPLFENGVVVKIQDFYTNKNQAITQLGGGKSVIKAFTNLYEVKEVSLPTFIAGFNFEDIGESLIEKLVEFGFDTLEKLQKATVNDIIKCSGFGLITAEKIMYGLSKFALDMREVLKYIKIIAPTKKGDKLKGLSFCFTGALNKMKRPEVEALVKENGGSVKGVTKGLSYLVTNEASSSAKYVKATELGIPVITEAQFFDLLK